MYYYFYHIMMVLSLIASLFVMTLAWRHRRCIGALAMLALAAETFIWTLGFLLEANSSTLERQLLFNNIGYLGLMAVPVAWFIFSLRYTNIGSTVRGWRLVPFCVIPLFITILIWSNDWHHLMWSNERLITSGDFLVTVKTYGPFFWVALTHNYCLVLAGAFIMLRRLFIGTPLYIGQAVSLMVAVGLPLIWNILHVFEILPPPRKDLTPVMFAFSGLAIALGVIRFRLLSTIPFARKFVIQQLCHGVFVFDFHNRLVEANPAALRIFPAGRNLIGKKLEELAPLSPVFECLSPGEFGSVELILKVSGDDRYCEIETVPMLDNRENQVGWLATVHDITGRKKAEEQYKLVTGHSADVIYKLQIKGELYTYISPSVERLLGYTDKEALALTPKTILTPESYEHQYSELLKDINEGTCYRTLELEAIHKDGHIVPVETHCSLVYDKKGEPVEIVGVARDITERRKMEEQLIMQDRLASIGQLTSGVAHELNNPLTSIISFSALLLQSELPDDVKQDLQTINDEAQRTAQLVKNLLTFARTQPQEKQLININEGIKKVLELRAYEQKINNIQVEDRLAPDLPRIMGNSPQLQQVFFNIVINAEFFMLKAHGKGILTVTTEKVGDYVRASFADDGPGIPKADQIHMFTPFFTTKEVGQGTGMSLSICLGILTEHGGRIWAESEPDKGSLFIIELPVYHGSDG